MGNEIMATGILMLLGVFAAYIISKIGEGLNTPMPPAESDEEFWDYFVTLSGIADPAERRRFEMETKRKRIERQRQRAMKK